MSVERATRKSGEVVWRVRWRDSQGRNRSRVLGRKRDADAFDAEIKRRRRTGELAALDAGRETLDEYVSGTWSRAHAATLAPATQAVYSVVYDRHISPWLGGSRLRELSPEAIGAWQGSLIDRGVGRPTVRKAITLLGSILQRAFESGRIPANPQRAVRKARQTPPEEVRPLAPATIEAMRSASGERDATLISVLAYAGLRPHEALALRWGHVRERTLVVTSAKTGRRRTVPLLAPLATDLARWRLASGRPDDTTLVFPGTDNKPWTKAGIGDEGI